MESAFFFSGYRLLHLESGSPPLWMWISSTWNLDHIHLESWSLPPQIPHGTWTASTWNLHLLLLESGSPSLGIWISGNRDLFHLESESHPPLGSESPPFGIWISSRFQNSLPRGTLKGNHVYHKRQEFLPRQVVRRASLACLGRSDWKLGETMQHASLSYGTTLLDKFFTRCLSVSTIILIRSSEHSSTFKITPRPTEFRDCRRPWQTGRRKVHSYSSLPPQQKNCSID